MLSGLPSEIIYHIAIFLPTASALASLAQTCRRLYRIITAEDARIFRAFVQSRFPSIETPPFWKDAAQALTSRSRALDRHAIIGRFVIPAPDAKKVGSHRAIRGDNPTLGYRPAIDSYEVWTGNSWADRKEVLAWGAADQLALRIRKSGHHPDEQWLMFNDLEHISSYDDICGVHLLRPEHPSKDVDKENIIFGRLCGDLVHISISPDEGTHEYKQTFVTNRTELDRTDISDGPDPILAAHFYNGSIAFFRTTTGESKVEPFAVLKTVPEELERHKYSKFLSPNRIAGGTGDLSNSVTVYNITPQEVSRFREIGVDIEDLYGIDGVTRRAHVSSVAPLHTTAQMGGSPGDLFLAGWGDGVVRLHDLRSDKPYENTFRDTIDNSPVYSILPFGHDRFLVGAGADAIVKIFDLRMPKNTYNYLDAKLPSIDKPATTTTTTTTTTTNGEPQTNGTLQPSIPNAPRKDFSIFISHRPPTNSIRPLARSSNRNRPYRGPIYTLSSPSPSSPTVYAGIVDGVFRLDFASTDDLTDRSRRDWYATNLSLGLNMRDESESTPVSERTLPLSGYERPSPEEMHRSAKLRVQKPFSLLTEEDVRNEHETGWDRRWLRLEEDGAWRRRG